MTTMKRASLASSSCASSDASILSPLKGCNDALLLPQQQRNQHHQQQKEARTTMTPRPAKAALSATDDAHTGGCARSGVSPQTRHSFQDHHQHHDRQWRRSLQVDNQQDRPRRNSYHDGVIADHDDEYYDDYDRDDDGPYYDDGGDDNDYVYTDYDDDDDDVDRFKQRMINVEDSADTMHSRDGMVMDCEEIDSSHHRFGAPPAVAVVPFSPCGGAPPRHRNIRHQPLPREDNARHSRTALRSYNAGDPVRTSNGNINVNLNINTNGGSRRSCLSAATATYRADNDIINNNNHSSSNHSHGDMHHRPLTEDIVHAFLVDYYEDHNSIAPLKVRECWETFFARFYTPEYIFVRPSGNTIETPAIIDLFMQNDMKMEEMTLVSVDSVQILEGGTVAIAVYTSNQRFKYKGIQNADQTVYTAIIESIDGEPKIVHEHRSSGHPIPTEETRWQTAPTVQADVSLSSSQHHHHSQQHDRTPRLSSASHHSGSNDASSAGLGNDNMMTASIAKASSSTNSTAADTYHHHINQNSHHRHSNASSHHSRSWSSRASSGHFSAPITPTRSVDEFDLNTVVANSSSATEHSTSGRTFHSTSTRSKERSSSFGLVPPHRHQEE